MENSQSSPNNINVIPLVAVLISGAFIAILNQTLLTTALPDIMDDLQLSANTAQWLTSIFMLVNGVMIPITAFLIEKFTTRKLFLTAMGSFALGTLICAFAPNFPLLLTGRIVQAAGAGIMIPLMQTVIFIVFPVEKRGAAMGLFGLVIAFAPAIGPTLSGWLVDHYSWRSMFYIILPIALIDLVCAYFILKNVTKQTFPKVDFLSIILSSLGFGGLLYGFSTAGSSGWSSMEVIISLVIGVITLGFFIWRQFVLKQPILEFRVFKYGIFSLTTVLGMLTFMSLIGATTIIPIYMQNMRDFTALESGLMLMPGALVMGIMSPITGRIFDKVGAKWLSTLGLTIVTVTTFMFTDLDSSTSFTYLVLVYALRMLGVAMVMMPVTTAGLNQIPQHLIPHGSAMNNTMRQVSGAIGTALLVTVMTSSALNRSQKVTDTHMTDMMIHGVNTAFMVATIIAGIGVVLSFFLKGTHPQAKSEQKDTINVQEKQKPITEK